jgi:hypothetical protein
VSGLGLSEQELDMLARYNTERSRGLMHTEAWQQQMAVLQARFDQVAYQGWCDSHKQQRLVCENTPVRGACIVGLTGS